MKLKLELRSASFKCVTFILLSLIDDWSVEFFSRTLGFRPHSFLFLYFICKKNLKNRFLPTHVRRLGAKFSSGSGHEQTKLPSVFLHLCEHPPLSLAHSSTSKIERKKK